MYDLAPVEMGGQARHHFRLHQFFHLEGDARQGNDRLAAPGEPHAGGRAVHVLQHLCGGGDHRLFAVQFVVFDAAGGEYPLVAFVGGGIAHHVAAEDSGERLFRDVVFRGAEAAGDDHRVGGAQGTLYGLSDLPPVVAHGEFPYHGESRFVQPCGDPCRIGVDDLSDEDFVADGDDLCFHVSVWFYPAVKLGKTGGSCCCGTGIFGGRLRRATV